MGRLRPKLNEVAGARLFLQPAQDIRVGGRANNAQYQYTLQATTRRDLRVGAEARSRVAEGAAADRRQSRPAAKGARDRSGHRPRDRGAARADRQPDRQHALRRLRPAPGVDDLRRAKPVPRHHGGGARILAEPGHPEPDLCQHQRRRGQRHASDQRACRNGAGQGAAANSASAADDHRADRRRHGAQPGEQRARQHRPRRHLDRRCGQHLSRNNGAAFRVCPFRPGQHAARGQSPKSLRRLDDLVQSRAGRLAQPGDGGDRGPDAPARRAGVDPRQLSGHRQGLSAIARQ